MTAPTAPQLLAIARSRAADGAWEDVRRLLVAGADLARSEPELTTLRAESELRTGRPREARTWIADAMPQLERSGDRAALRRAVNYLGVADVELGALDDARDVFARALDIARTDGDDLLFARATNNLGAIANIRGRRVEALTLYELAVPAYQRLGHSMGLAESYHNIAITCRQLGQLERADEYERRAMTYAREIGNDALHALAALGRAELSLLAGDAAVAEAGAARAAAVFAALPDAIREGDALRVVGAAQLAQGRLERATASVERALSLARQHGSALNEAEALQLRAELRERNGDVGAARADACAALERYERLGAAPESETITAWIARLDAAN